MRESQSGKKYDEFGRPIKKKGFFDKITSPPPRENIGISKNEDNTFKRSSEKEEFDAMQEDLAKAYDEIEEEFEKEKKEKDSGVYDVEDFNKMLNDKKNWIYVALVIYFLVIFLAQI